MAEESNEKVSDSAKNLLALIDSTLLKALGKIISIIVVPVGLFFLYHAWDALEQYGKDIAGIQITLNDMKVELKDLHDGFGTQIGQISHDEHEDQTDIAVLKAEVESPRAPLQQAAPEPQAPEPQRFVRPRHVDTTPPIIKAIEHAFDPHHHH